MWLLLLSYPTHAVYEQILNLPSFPYLSRLDNYKQNEFIKYLLFSSYVTHSFHLDVL